MRPSPPRTAVLAPRPTAAQATAPRAAVTAVPPLAPTAQPKGLQPAGSAAPVAPRVVAVEEE